MGLRQSRLCNVTVSIPTIPDPIVFTATEPVAAPGPPATGIPMQITISNTNVANDIANIVISYGPPVPTPSPLPSPPPSGAG